MQEEHWSPVGDVTTTMLWMKIRSQLEIILWYFLQLFGAIVATALVAGCLKAASNSSTEIKMEVFRFMIEI